MKAVEHFLAVSETERVLREIRLKHPSLFGRIRTSGYSTEIYVEAAAAETTFNLLIDRLRDLGVSVGAVACEHGLDGNDGVTKEEESA